MTEEKKGAIFIVYGPQRCGKTGMAPLIQEAFKADRVIDNGLSLLGKHAESNWRTIDAQADVGLRVVVLTNEIDEPTEELLQALIHAHPHLKGIIPFKTWLGNYQGLRTENAWDVLAAHWDTPHSEVVSITYELENLADNIHEANKKVGWWDELEGMNDRQRRMLFAEKLALVHSEVTEALEGVRTNSLDDKLPWRWTVEAEIADAIIRLIDLAKGMDLEVGAPLMEKLAFNATRADHKRENRAKAGGKAF